MKTITFYVGLARHRIEIEARGYKRQPITLTFHPDSGKYLNVMPVDFGQTLWPWGFIDGMILATSPDGPVMAVSPLLIPIFIKSGDEMTFAPGHIGMDRKSLDAIVNIPPIKIAS